MMNYKVEKYIGDDNCSNCLWNNGLIAKIKTQKGDYCILAIGDVQCSLIAKKDFIKNGEKIKKGEEIAYIKGDGDGFYHEMNGYIKNDKNLDKIISGEHPLYKLEFEYNNWYELDFLNKNGKYEGLDIVLDTSLLDEAIEETIEMIPELEEENEKELV